MAGLSATIQDDECVDDGDSLSLHTPTTSPGTASDAGSRAGRRVTAVGVLQALVDRQDDRKETAKRQQAVDEERTSLLARALGQDKGSSTRFPGVDEQFSIAVAYLGQLQTHEDIEDDEDAMYVVRCVADVVHGSEQGPAQRMAACVWALAERDLPVARAVRRLQALAPRRVMGGGSGSGSGDGGFIRPE